MCVGRAEDQAVLNDEGGDPEVVRRDRASLPLQIAVQSGVVMRCLFIRQQQADLRLPQEFPVGQSGPESP